MIILEYFVFFVVVVSVNVSLNFLLCSRIKLICLCVRVLFFITKIVNSLQSDDNVND